MRIALFCHSLLSDWNHGNAHFLRGIASELCSRGHDVRAYEPRDAWSVRHLIREQGEAATDAVRTVYPRIAVERYDRGTLDLDRALDGADLVMVHEWNDRDLIERIGTHRARSGKYRLLFHDTHHRSITDQPGMAACDLAGYDGVLVFGDVIRGIYLRQGWARRVWTWHEAADTRIFHPVAVEACEGDLTWIGNWGDEERTAELHEFLLEPVRALRLRARVYGVRYPPEAQIALRQAGAEYLGWLPNYEVPDVFARFRATVHVPRRPYAGALPGIPTIRVFEALACGIPLISAPWEDCENLFAPGKDFLIARNGTEMTKLLRFLLSDPEAARETANHGLRTILGRHTCAHRVDELLEICAQLRLSSSSGDPYA
jgi:spore maturation protein CgeB